jgi:NitT/TauT family transport system substrate-binding protein
MKKQSGYFIILLLAMLITACSPKGGGTQTEIPVENPVTIKIAVLPIIDALPMYVAESEGLFEKNGIKLEFIPVASAPERDQLLSAGQADGTINETLAVMLFNKEKTQLQVVRYALRPTEGHGHFFILAS